MMISLDELNAIQVNGMPKKSSEKSIKSRSEGNRLYRSQYHNKKVHLDILAHYNKSVAYAENDSEEMALAISNRSALLMHLNMHKEALHDIEKSCEITKSEELRIKLLTRKMKCMSHMDQEDKDKKLNTDTNEPKIPTIAKVSKTIPCAADCVSIVYDEKYGRCIVATEDIKPGTILVIEKGLLVLPKREKTYINCSHCLMLACNGVPCNSCAVVIYCSEQCKEEAWLQYHDLECLILTYLRQIDDLYKNLSHMIFAVRLLIKFIKKEGLQNIVIGTEKIKMNKAKDEFLNSFFENGVFESDKFQSFYNLSQQTNTTYLQQSRIYNYIIIKKIINCLAEKTDIFSNYYAISNDSNETFLNFIMDVLRNTILIMLVNGSEFAENACYCEHPEICGFSCGDQEIGGFVSTFGSLLNHSCDQNTCKIFTKNQEVVVFALESIKKGEQLFTNYVPEDWSKVDRQNLLKKDYDFICQCERCVKDLPKKVCEKRSKSEYSYLLTTLLKSDIDEKSIELIHEPLHNMPFNETTIKNVLKMCQIVEKYKNSAFAYRFLLGLKRYMCLYFIKLYNVTIFNVPNSC